MEKRVQDYTQDILAVVRSNTSPAAMSDKLGDFHANDIADAMPRLTVQERCKLYRILELDMLSDIFEYTDSDNAAEYVKEMDVKKGAAILSRMETDALVEVLHKIDKAKKKLLFELMDDDVRHDIEMIASFDEDEIGSRMTTNCIIIRENLTVKQAMNSLVEQAAKNDNISTIFVVTESQKFYGAIDLKDLIIARQDKSLEDLVATSYPYVYAEEDIDDCIEELKAYSEDSIPVLDNDNRLLGVITSSNIIDLVDDEMGEDYAMLAGLTAEEDLKEPLKESMKKRMPWLIVLLGLGIVDGGGPRRHGDGGESDAGALHFAAAAAGVRPDAEKRVAGTEGGSAGTAGAFEGAEGAEVSDAGTGAAGGHPSAGDRCVDRGAGGGRAGYSYADRSAGHRRGRCHRRVHHHGGYLRRGGPDVRGGTKSKLSGLITIKNGS